MDDVYLTDDEKGKRVVNMDGDTLGMVTDVSDDSIAVNPSPGIAETIRAKLGWGDADEADYVLSTDRIGEITDDEIRLK